MSELSGCAAYVTRYGTATATVLEATRRAGIFLASLATAAPGKGPRDKAEAQRLWLSVLDRHEAWMRRRWDFCFVFGVSVITPAYVGCCFVFDAAVAIAAAAVAVASTAAAAADAVDRTGTVVAGGGGGTASIGPFAPDFTVAAALAAATSSAADPTGIAVAADTSSIAPFEAAR